MTEFSQTGLTITIADPLVKTDRSATQENISAKINSYSHELRRIGGYWSGKINLTGSLNELNDWLQNGINRHVQVYNSQFETVWEGFVNQVDIQQGNDRFTVGPLVAIGNRVSITYSTIDTSVDPPVLGQRATTATADNDASTALYGFWHKLKSINGANSTQALQMRDGLLNDPTRAFPATSSNVVGAGGGSLNLSIACLGYWAYLKAWYYSNSATGTVNLSTKIQDVLGDDPNSVFSSDYSKITANTTAVQDGYDGGQTAETVLKNLNSFGDASDNAYSMGFYKDRRLVYATIPTAIAYHKRQGRDVTDQLGARIRPWNVQPAEWLFRPDFLIGRNPPITADTLGSDPRTGLIEQVTYTSPYGLAVNGVKLSELDQVFARQGIGGLA